MLFCVLNATNVDQAVLDVMSGSYWLFHSDPTLDLYRIAQPVQ
jgi:hypothetical protein